MRKAAATLIGGLLTFAANCQTFTTPLAVPPTLSGPDFDLTVKDTTNEFITGLTSQTFGINQQAYLGPTLIMEKGDMVDFNIENATSEDSITVHWHGFHLPAAMDGGPMNEILPGDVWNPSFEVMNNASMMWYHSHAHNRTLYQVNKGIAGMIIIQDAVESQLDLPRTYGVDDFPVVIQDKEINLGNGNLEPALLGNLMMVNGTIEPYVELPAQVVRLRLINASVERVYMLGFDDNRTFEQIGTDGGLLETPVTLNRLPLAPGERAEVLLDLTGESVGTDLFLMSYSTEFNGEVAGSCNVGPGCGQGPLDNTDFEIMKLSVVGQTGNPVTSIPSTLTTIAWLDEGDVDTVRTKTLLNPAAPGSPFTIDGGSFDMNVINDHIPLGNTEVWTFTNNSGIAHPMHIHDVQFNILRRNGVAPPANELGWKDVVLVYPDETVEVIAQFTDFADPVYTYMMHCHSLGHEDVGMMEQFVIVDTTTVGIDHAESKNVLSVFPNPTNGNVVIDLEEISDPKLMQVFDMAGKLIHTSSITNQRDLNYELPAESGAYSIQIIDVQGETYNLKVLRK